jgi:hypothetical protein
MQGICRHSPTKRGIRQNKIASAAVQEKQVGPRGLGRRCGAWDASDPAEGPGQLRYILLGIVAAAHCIGDRSCGTLYWG